MNAKELAVLVKANEYLVRVERYGDENAYDTFVNTLKHAGFCQIGGKKFGFPAKMG